jgi:CrcB protein
MTLVGIALLGGLGAVVRVLIGRTLVVNLTGAFALGLLVGAGADADTARILGTGFLGAYTTFSTWMLETRRPRDVVLPLLAGLLAIFLGRTIA